MQRNRGDFDCAECIGNQVGRISKTKLSHREGVWAVFVDRQGVIGACRGVIDRVDGDAEWCRAGGNRSTGIAAVAIHIDRDINRGGAIVICGILKRQSIQKRIDRRESALRGKLGIGLGAINQTATHRISERDHRLEIGFRSAIGHIETGERIARVFVDGWRCRRGDAGIG